LEETTDDQEVIARIAALDVGKAELVCCIGCPARAGPGAGCRKC
jgi:transposase